VASADGLSATSGLAHRLVPGSAPSSQSFSTEDRNDIGYLGAR